MSDAQEKITLSDVITTEKGKPPAAIPYYGEGAELYLSPEYLRGNTSAETAQAGANTVRVDDGDIILLWDGSNAGEFFKARKGLVASTMARLNHSDEFDRSYFFYAVKQWEPYLKGQTSGSGIPHVDKEVLGNLSILRLPKSEQTQIAAILTTVDRAIEQTEAIIAKQQRIKTGLMQDLLTRGIDAQGNIRSEATHEFKDSPLGRIPVEWEVGLFGDFVRQTGGVIQTGPFGTQLHASEYQNEGVPMVMPQDVADSGWISDDKLVHVSKSKARELQRHAMQSNDVIFARRGDLSRCAVISEREENWICGTDFMLVRVPRSRIIGFWIAIIYRSFVCQKQVLANAVGSTMLGINTGLLSNLVVPIPSVDEQERILSVIQSIDSLILVEFDKQANLKATKTGLMQDLLTGRVRVGGTTGGSR